MAQLDLVGMVVQDMAKALDFYRELGWDIPAEMGGEGHAEYVLPHGLRVAWDTYDVIRSFNEDWQPPAGGHGIGLAFLCESAAAVDALYQRLVDKGYAGHKEPFDAFWGQRYAQIEDPDGNVVDLFARLE